MSYKITTSLYLHSERNPCNTLPVSNSVLSIHNVLSHVRDLDFLFPIRDSTLIVRVQTNLPRVRDLTLLVRVQTNLSHVRDLILVVKV